MIRVILIILASLILAITSFAAVNMMPSVSDLPMQVTSRSSEANGILLALELVEPVWTTVGTEEAPVEVAELLNGGFIEEEGYPLIPITGRLFRLPPTGGVTVEVIEAEYETLSGIEYAAYFNDSNPQALAQVEEPRDEWYPEQIATVDAPGICHDFRVSKLVVSPIQVNTAREEVRVYSNIQVRLNFNNDDDRSALESSPSKISETYLPWYRLFLDWDENELDEYELYRGHVQVVLNDTRPEGLFWSALQPWIEWKRQKGWDLEFIMHNEIEDDFTSLNIHNLLIERWEEAEEKFDYVVIIGDATGFLPVPSGPPGDHWSYGDFYYSLMTPDDQIPDVAVGRISVENIGMLSTYMSKVFRYEREPYLEETDWYLRGALLGVWHYFGVSTCNACSYWRYEMLNLGYTEVDTNYTRNRNVTPTISSLNEGVTFYNFLGGISDGLNQDNINSLANIDKLYFACEITDQTGDWMGLTSISEHHIRLGTAQAPRGAIGAIGEATCYTNEGRNNALSGGVAFALFRLHQPAMGDGVFGAWMNLYTNYIHNQPIYYREFCDKVSLMGDPTLWLWTAIPQDLEIRAGAEFELGQNSYSVTVTDGERPLTGAWVTLYKVDEEEEIIAKGVTNSEGIVILETPFQFTGEAMLTVTHQNFRPYRQEIEVVSPQARLGYEAISFLDNGENGTVGNSNGIPEAGETIGLLIEAKNYGVAEEIDVLATASGDDPWAVEINGVVEFGDIGPGESVLGDDLILVEIAPEAQNSWILHLDIILESVEAVYRDDFPIVVNAPQLAFVNMEGLDGFDPGENARITIQLRNVGNSDLSPSNGLLESLDNYLTIPEAVAPFPAIPMQTTQTSGEFLIAANPVMIPGSIAHARLIVTSEIGQVDSVLITIPIGSRRSTDPCGPDRYGYYAFDNTDIDYQLHPEYEWIEINPIVEDHDYNGTNLNIIDLTNNNDHTVSVGLPFPVQYYGEVYNRALVCSNGWISLGDLVYFTDLENYWIPSPLGPPNMIAPYWDDRTTLQGGGVFTYYDEPNDRFIVEWYQLPDYQGMWQSSCTFEVIIYDQVLGHLTYTNDAEILFQYGPVFHTTGPTGGHGRVEYYTTGIEDESQTDGILYSYWNQPQPGAARVQEGRAILFSTNYNLILGSIDGHVRRYENENPVVNARVSTLNRYYFADTDEEGYFRLDNVMIGVHDLVVEATGFNDILVEGVEVSENETTTIEIGGDGQDGRIPGMTHPEFHCDTEFLQFHARQDEPVGDVFTLSNFGNGNLDYEIQVLLREPEMAGGYDVSNSTGELDEPWDEFYSFDLIPGETRNRGVTFFNNSFWVAGSYNSNVGINRLYRYDRNGLYLATYNQPVVNHSSVGFYGLTNDGHYLYGHDRGRVYQMEFTGNDVIAVQSWQVPLNIAKGIAYDTNEDLIWICISTEGLYGLDLSGDQPVTVHQYELEEEIRGIAFYPDDPDGFCLYLIFRDDDEIASHIKKMNPNTGNLRDVITYEGGGYLQEADVSNKFNPLCWTFAVVIDGGAQDRIQIWELDLNTHWIDIDPQMGALEPDSEQEIAVTINPENLPPDNYIAWLEVNHNAIDQTYIIPLSIEIIGYYTMAIPLQENYFELTSLYIQPEIMDAGSVFGAIPHLEIVYQDDGSIYVPPDINTIGEIDLTEGYGIYCDAPSEFVLEGRSIDPELEFSLSSNRWNWLGYPFRVELPVVFALQEIAEELYIIMNDDGDFWIPEIPLNTLGVMRPGEGYFTFVENDVTFQYHHFFAAEIVSSDVLNLPAVEGAPAPTGLPYVVLVRMTEALKSQHPAIIELYDGNLLVGKGAVLEEREITPVVAWGGSPNYGLQGFKLGNSIVIKVKSSDGALAAQLNDNRFTFGTGAFADLTLDALDTSIPTEFAVGQGYPNPFNPSITVPFALPAAGEVIISVFNVLGQQVLQVNRFYQAGYHQFLFDADAVGADLGSGLYFLQVQYNCEVRIQKVMLMK